ncbi:MAG TPA: ATP-binding protein [Myxococcales bacterium]
MSPEELVAQLPIAAFIVDVDRIAAVNDRLAQLLGYSEDELLDGTGAIEKFLPAAERERIWERHKARLSGLSEPAEYAVRMRHASGVEIPARARVTRFPAAGPEAVLVLISDERERDRTTVLIRGFVDAATRAMRERTQAGILRAAREHLESLGLTVSTMEVDGDRMRVVDTGKGNFFLDKLRERWPEGAPTSLFPGPPKFGDTGMFIDDVPSVRAKILGLPRSMFETGPRHSMVSTIALPGGKSLIFSAQADRLDASVASAFGLLGKQLGAALESAQRLEEANQRNAELSLLLELGRAVMGALDEAKVVQAAARWTVQVLRCNCAYVLLPDAQETSLRVAAIEDPLPIKGLAVGGIMRFSDASLAALAYRTCGPYMTNDIGKDSRIDEDLKRRSGCHSAMAVPLLSQGRALGVLSVLDRGNRKFDTQDIRLATHAAQLIASALLNARLFSEQRARAEEMVLLNDVALRLAGSLERKPLLELGGEALRKLLGAESWLAFLPEPRTNTLRFPDDVDSELRRSAEAAFRDQMPVQLASALVLPLLARSVPLGVLAVCKPQSYTSAQADQALAVAGALALALLSARLYEDLSTSYVDLARTQAELIDRERLAALGELSASIAHEVRNPLGVIFNSVGSLRRLLKPSADVAFLLDVVSEEADRLNRMVADLLDYSRPIQPALEPVLLEPLLEEAVGAAQQQIGAAASSVQVELKVAQDAATVRADARLLRQALLNLLLNAHQAMPRGGRLEVQAASGRLDGEPCTEIAIRDSGSGIPQEALSRIFQPFFTTKATGTGLGLAVVRRIVEGHGGAVAVGRPVAGAEFLVRLPTAEGGRLTPPHGTGRRG